MKVKGKGQKSPKFNHCHSSPQQLFTPSYTNFW